LVAGVLLALPGDLMPRALLVEYLPVEFTEAGEDGRVFAKNLTQFYLSWESEICCVLGCGCAVCFAVL
jgi:hypothetical protein